jgi:uncharacterized membrane-anchored protein
MKLKLFILVLLLQSAWLLGMVVSQEHALATGKVVMLETRRVDPNDPLRGDYLILNYKISDVPLNLFSPPVNKDLPMSEVIYVALEPRGEFYEVTKASTNRFDSPASQILLKGKSAWGRWNDPNNAIHIEYGLENFYVAEGTGHPRGKLTAQVVVPASGHASLKEVFVDGKPYAEAMKDSGN